MRGSALFSVLAIASTCAAQFDPEQCGPKAGNQKCRQNKCCSQYGWCGTTNAYCRATSGCQPLFGRCTGAVPAPPSPSPSSSSPPVTQPANALISKDGRCGSAFGGRTCKGSIFGNCCSAYNWCGTTSGHCKASSGCQLAFGTCTGVTSSSSLSVSRSSSSIRQSSSSRVSATPSRSAASATSSTSSSAVSSSSVDSRNPSFSTVLSSVVIPSASSASSHSASLSSSAVSSSIPVSSSAAASSSLVASSAITSSSLSAVSSQSSSTTVPSSLSSAVSASSSIVSISADSASSGAAGQSSTPVTSDSSSTAAVISSSSMPASQSFSSVVGSSSSSPAVLASPSSLVITSQSSSASPSVTVVPASSIVLSPVSIFDQLSSVSIPAGKVVITHILRAARNPAVNRIDPSHLEPSNILSFFYAEEGTSYTNTIQTTLDNGAKGILLENIAGITGVTCSGSSISLEFDDDNTSDAAGRWPSGTLLFALSDTCNSGTERGVYRLQTPTKLRARVTGPVMIISSSSSEPSVPASTTLPVIPLRRARTLAALKIAIAQAIARYEQMLAAAAQEVRDASSTPVPSSTVDMSSVTQTPVISATTTQIATSFSPSSIASSATSSAPKPAVTMAQCGGYYPGGRMDIGGTSYQVNCGRSSTYRNIWLSMTFQSSFEACIALCSANKECLVATMGETSETSDNKFRCMLWGAVGYKYTNLAGSNEAVKASAVPSVKATLAASWATSVVSSSSPATAASFTSESSSYSPTSSSVSAQAT
ncbi:hypothetical protein ACN47E_001657 [Coniothyrium glycines]